MKRLLSYILLLPIYFYRACISPMTPPSCRFTPTCSQYAIEAIKKHGPFKGLYLAVRRILRCHPGVDQDTIRFLNSLWIFSIYIHIGCLLNLDRRYKIVSPQSLIRWPVLIILSEFIRGI